MKKFLFLFLSAITFIACKHCDVYPYCHTDFSIHPDNWLCGRLKAEPSPFDEKDTVVAMTIKYVYQSDMNGLTYFITKNNVMFSLLDESGNRKDSIFMCTHNGKKFVLYPYKKVKDFPPEIVCFCNLQYLISIEERLQGEIENDMDLYQGCLNPGDGVLIFDYEMEINGGQTYDKVTEKGDTIHMFDINSSTHFENVFHPD